MQIILDKEDINILRDRIDTIIKICEGNNEASSDFIDLDFKSIKEYSQEMRSILG